MGDSPRISGMAKRLLRGYVVVIVEALRLSVVSPTIDVHPMPVHSLLEIAR